MYRKIYLLIILSFIFLISGCSKTRDNTEDETLFITASTTIIADVVENVAGDKAIIFTLIDTDPHSFEPSPKDVAKIEESDIIFVNGFGLEENLTDVLYINAKCDIVEVSKGIEPLFMEEGHYHDSEETEHDHENMDPHTWTSPGNVIIWVNNITDAMCSIDPVNLQYYKDRAVLYTDRINEILTDIESKVETIPVQERIIVTDHDFLGYFARDYNFTVVGTIIPSVSTQAEPSPKDISELVENIKQYSLNTIFIGNTSGERIDMLSKAVSNELNYDIEIRTLLTGTLNSRGSSGDTYLSYIEYNTDQIISGLKD